MDERLLESAASLLGRRRLHQFHDGRGRRAHPGDLSRQLSTPGRSETQIRSEQSLPREPEHLADRFRPRLRESVKWLKEKGEMTMEQKAGTEMVNGVNVGKLFETIDSIRQTPNLAVFKFRSSGRSATERGVKLFDNLELP